MALVLAAFVLAKMFGVSRQASVGWGAIAAMVFLVGSFFLADVCSEGTRFDDDMVVLTIAKSAVFAFTVLFLAVCASAKVSTGVAAGLALIIITVVAAGIVKQELDFNVRSWFWPSFSPMIALLVAGPMIRYGMKYDRPSLLVASAAVIVGGLIVHTMWLSAGHKKIEEAAAK